MKLNRSAIISSITDTFQVLAFIALASFTLSVLLLSLVLVLFGNSWMLEHFQTCQVALRPVGCESKVMTPRSALESSETLTFLAESSKTTFCHYLIKNPHRSSIACLAQSLKKEE